MGLTGAVERRHLPQLKTRWVGVKQWQIFTRYSESAGQERPAFVLVHGLSMSGQYFVPTARRLARDYRVYVPDLPGYGRTAHPQHVLNIDELARVLCDWLEQLGIGPAYFLSNSMGTQTLVTLAARHPQRVLKAALVGPTMDPSALHLPHLLLRGFMNMLFEPLRFYPVLAQDYLRAGVKETWQALEDAIQDPVQEKLAQMPMPTLVARGEHDWLVSQAWARQVTRLLPDGFFQVIPGAAHVVNFDAPEKLTGLVEWFAKQDLRKKL